MQPVVHLLSPLQTGDAAGQSRCARHVTHFPSSSKQNGAAAPQWLFAVQPTHCLVIGSQIGRPVPAHSASARQPTHWPVTASHFGASPGQAPSVHFGRHSWFSGQQDGADAGQSAFVEQTSQLPRTQRGAAAPQAESLVHSTHPMVGSQVRPVGHVATQAPPVPPGPRPISESVSLPPHATATPPTKQARARRDRRVRCIRGRYRGARASRQPDFARSAVRSP